MWSAMARLIFRRPGASLALEQVIDREASRSLLKTNETPHPDERISGRALFFSMPP